MFYKVPSVFVPALVEAGASKVEMSIQDVLISGYVAGAMLRIFGLVFVSNFLGALTVSVFTAITFTCGFATALNGVGEFIVNIGQNRTTGYKEYGVGAG